MWQYEISNYNLIFVSANCLYTITEDNAPIIKMCHNPEVYQLINSLILKESSSSDLVLLKTLATGRLDFLIPHGLLYLMMCYVSPISIKTMKSICFHLKSEAILKKANID